MKVDCISQVSLHFCVQQCGRALPNASPMIDFSLKTLAAEANVSSEMWITESFHLPIKGHALGQRFDDEQFDCDGDIGSGTHFKVLDKVSTMSNSSVRGTLVALDW